jgi:hypothetical protein
MLNQQGSQLQIYHPLLVPARLSIPPLLPSPTWAYAIPTLQIS